MFQKLSDASRRRADRRAAGCWRAAAPPTAPARACGAAAPGTRPRTGYLQQGKARAPSVPRALQKQILFKNFKNLNIFDFGEFEADFHGKLHTIHFN